MSWLTCSAQEEAAIVSELSTMYDRIKYNDGYYQVWKNNLAGLCDNTGKLIISTKYKSVSFNSLYNCISIVSSDGKDGVANSGGKIIIPPTKYKNIHIDAKVSDKSSWLGFSVYVNEKVGYCDLDGNEIIKPTSRYNCIFKDAHFNYFIVSTLSPDPKNNKMGVCDSLGHEIIPPIYDAVTRDYVHNYYDISVVKDSDRRYGKCDSTGKVIIPPIYKNFIMMGNDQQYFYCSYDNVITLFHKSGKQLLQTEKQNFVGISENLLCYKSPQGLYGYIDIQTSKCVIQPEYTSAECFIDGVAKVSKGDTSFLISNPLKNGKLTELATLSVSNSETSDVDIDIPETAHSNENTFAFIIANQNYSDFVVSYAMNDGRVFMEYCQKTLGIPKSNITYYEDATLNNIYSLMTRMRELADVYDGDAKIIFYYSGQGICSVKDKTAYLYPTDGTLTALASTGYSLNKLYSEIGQLNVASSVIILDAGFNGANRENTMIETGRGVALMDRTATIAAPNTIILQASSAGETALSYKGKAHGLFSYFLFKKLKETKGDVNLFDLSNYIIKHVEQVSIVEYKVKQTPQIKCPNNLNLNAMIL